MRAWWISLAGLWMATAAVASGELHDALHRDPVPDLAAPPAVEELTFESEGARLPGVLYLANGKGPHPTVLLLHGLPGNEKNLDLAQSLRRVGFNALFFHYRGAWGAEGAYRLTALAQDVAAAVEYLREHAGRYRVDPERISLLGHSMGGFASLAAGRRDRKIPCVGAMAPVNLGAIAEGIRRGDAISLGLLAYADQLFMLRGFDSKAMRADLMSAPPAAIDTRLYTEGLRGKSVFLITGERDRVLPPASSFDPVVAAYQKDPAIRLAHHTIPGDHSFSQSRIQLTHLVADWLMRDCR